MKRTFLSVLLVPLALGCVVFEATEDKGADAQAVPKADPADVAAVTRGDNEFALDLYAKLRGKDGNLFFSPYSISTALAMTRAGAKGETAEQMDKVMHFTLPQDKLNPTFRAIIHQINISGDPANSKRGYKLNTANDLWVQKDLPINGRLRRPAQRRLRRHRIGGLQGRHGAGPAADQRLHRGGDPRQDQGPAAEGDLTEDTRLVLTNAIYFKGDWTSQFKKDATKNQPFHLAADKKIDAPMMFQKGRFGYLDGGTFQALEMPYGNGDLSMVVLLPKKIDGLADLEKALSADKLAGWVGKLQRQEVIVTLPKFKTEQRVMLAQTLAEMGMDLVFNDHKADLSGMAGRPGDLYISQVIHQAYIDVNEEGTEAAAATAVTIGAASVRVEPPTPEFRADHPFLFLIRDTRSGSILFLGRLADPTN